MRQRVVFHRALNIPFWNFWETTIEVDDARATERCLCDLKRIWVVSRVVDYRNAGGPSRSICGQDGDLSIVNRNYLEHLIGVEFTIQTTFSESEVCLSLRRIPH